MSAEDNKQTIRKIYQALAKGDRSVFADSVHTDYAWELMGKNSWAGRFEGQQQIREDLLKPLFALFATEYTAEAVNLIAEGDFVVAEVQGDVTTHAGGRYDNTYCFIFRFRGDKIAEVREYCDTDLEERVLGSYETAVARLAAGE